MEQHELKNYFKDRDFVHQIGFYAPDWKAFARAHHERFGSGPFYYTTNTFGRLIYRGKEIDCKGLQFHAAYGAWGSHSVEVVQQEPINVPTMFTDGNDMTKPGINHIHMFVEDLAEAEKACNLLGIPIVTIGYPDLANALEKAKATGASPALILANADKPSFMVVDMRETLGMMVQLITPRAASIHNLLLQARKEWDGETDLFRKL
ncbi:MAG: hypothetical protein IJI53_05860 [Clostridia bacterium]|nr:hypothetical protein [Clostridia bacterium]